MSEVFILRGLQFIAKGNKLAAINQTILVLRVLVSFGHVVGETIAKASSAGDENTIRPETWWTHNTFLVLFFFLVAPPCQPLKVSNTC